MRRIGTLTSRDQADRFRDYLLTRQITSQVDPAGDEWAIWVHEEDRLDETRTAFAQFCEHPEAPEYLEAVVAADRLRHDAVREAVQSRRRQVDLSRQWNRPLLTRIPVTFGVIVISVVVTLGTSFGENMYDAFGGRLLIAHVTRSGDYLYWDSTLREVRQGEIWRLVTPIFIHMNPLHLLLNMYWTSVFGGLLETTGRRWTLFWLTLVTAALSNVAQFWAVGPNFGGMSGVGYGLFGYVWIRGRVDRSFDLHVPQNLVVMFIAWFVICLTGLVGPVANYAHGFGFLAGAVLAVLATLARKLLKSL
jgi:GlpG protein